MPETFSRPRDLSASHDRFSRSPREHPGRLNECLDIKGRQFPLDALTLRERFGYKACNGEPTSVPRLFTLDLDLLNRQRRLGSL